MNSCRFKQRSGFTLVELLVVIAIIGVMVGLLLPAVQAAREAARRMSCGNNVKQIGLGLHNYHAAYNNLPMNRGGTVTFVQGNSFNLSWLVPILPFIEQQALFEQLSSPVGLNRDGTPRATSYPAMGPDVWDTNYVPWITQVPGYLCPSDGVSRVAPTAGQGMTGFNNYFACHGDTFQEQHHSGVQDNGIPSTDGNWGDTAASRWARGAFRARHFTRFRDFDDGLSNTIAVGEGTIDRLERQANSSTVILGAVESQGPGVHAALIIDPARPKNIISPLPAGYSISTAFDRGRGRRWADGRDQFSRFNTVRPPNSYNVAQSDEGRGFFSAGSQHQGGAHVLLADGAVKFITDSIEAGNQSTVAFGIANSQPGVASPYGLWGSLGTKATKETISAEF